MVRLVGVSLVLSKVYADDKQADLGMLHLIPNPRLERRAKKEKKKRWILWLP
jgi:hypothetical protein